MAIPSLNIGGGKWATKQYKLLAYKQNIGGRYFAINGDTSRNSTATFTNQNGLIDSVGNNVARVDFQDDVKGSLLLETQSTNLITQSESFANSYWIKSGASIQGDPSTAGIEEVVNGDFATDLTGWEARANSTASWDASGSALVDITGSGGGLTKDQTFALDVSATHKLSVDIKAGTFVGDVHIIFDNQSISVETLTSSYQTFTFYVNSTSSNPIIAFQRSTAVVGTISIDNISVKEVQGFASPSLDSPTGAFKLVEDTINSSHQLISLFSFTSGVSYTFSVFVKKLGSRDSIKIQAGNPATWGAESVFDLSNGTVSSTINGSAEIDGLYNGYYKCTVTGVANVTAGTAIVLRLYNGGTTYTGDGTSGVYIYGAQLEALPYATSYIPTSGSAVTRVKDVATNFGDVNSFNSSEGVLFVEMAALSNDTSFRAMSINDGYTTNRITLVYNGGIRVFNVSGGSVSSNLDYVTTITNTQKIAIVWSSSFFDLWVNGVKRGSGSGVSFSSGTLNTMGFEQGNGGNNMYAKVKQVQVYKEALTDAELITLTTI